MISQVALENWKAHEHFALDLTPGINFIMGPNGLGKTSLLEAISFGLIGETTTVSDPELLIRDPNLSAKISVTFGNNGTRRTVERSFEPGQKPSARLTDLNGKSLATSAKGVTSAITEFYGTNSEFFKRVVYMPEGEVFRFINEPPGTAVMGQIEVLLGINQMRTLRNAAAQVGKELKVKEASYRNFLQRYDQVASEYPGSKEENANPFSFLEQAQREQQSLTKRVGEIGGRRAEIRSRSVTLQQITQDVITLKQTIVSLNVPGGQDPIEYLTTQYRTIEREIETLRVQSETASQELGRLEGQSESYRDVLKLLQPKTESETGQATIPCPVCGKPLTFDERATIIADLNERLAKVALAQNTLRAQSSELLQKMRQAQTLLEPLRRNVSQIEQLRNRLVHVQDTPAIETEIEKLKQEDSALIAEQDMVNQKIHELQQRSATIAAFRTELQSLGFETVESLRDRGLVECYRGIILLDAADKATEATLQYQLDEGLRDVYKQIALVWKHFIHRHQVGDADWEIRFNPKGAASLGNVQTQRKFDVAQLSGGEKTALLVMIHTILARYFSKTDFLMVDEPLEHLDPVNRRSLIRFLVDAYDQGYFK
ncbi:partial putative DNA double-strand break repair Rad50 ATPase, partial [Anaerolineae bacterium]